MIRRAHVYIVCRIDLNQTRFFYLFQKAELKQCNRNVLTIKSANQLVYEYYHDISSAELKAYALVQLAYMFYTVYNRGKCESFT